MMASASAPDEVARPGTPSTRFPPGPPSSASLLETLLRFRDLKEDVLGVVADRFAIYGDFYYAPARGRSSYSTCDPDLIHEVLVTQARSFLKRPTSLEFLGKGLLTADGEFWRRQRRLIQPGFQRESIERYGAIITEEVEAMLARWARRRDIELRHEMQELTLTVVCRALFGQRFGGDTRRIGRAVAGLQESVLTGLFVPYWAPTPANFVRWQRERTVDREVFAILDAGAEPGSLLADLKAATDERGHMSRQQLRDEVVTLFLAGHETTALLLTWALVLVAQHPSAEQTLVDEARAIAGSERISFAHREKLAFTERVLKETLRLYPPVYVMPRVASEPLTLGGYRIEAGAEVWVWPYFTQRDARFFARPERFDPNRFLPGGEADKSPRAYLPFGAGNRACVGRHFAMLEAVVALASITRRFRVTLRDARPVFTHPRITLAPDRPVRARVEER